MAKPLVLPNRRPRNEVFAPFLDPHNIYTVVARIHQIKTFFAENRFELVICDGIVLLVKLTTIVPEVKCEELNLGIGTASSFSFVTRVFTKPILRDTNSKLLQFTLARSWYKLKLAEMQKQGKKGRPFVGIVKRMTFNEAIEQRSYNLVVSLPFVYTSESCSLPRKRRMQNVNTPRPNTTNTFEVGVLHEMIKN